MTQVYKRWNDVLAARPGSTESWATSRPSDNDFVQHGDSRLNHGPGIGCHLFCSCGSDAVGRWIGDGGPC